MGTQNQYVLAMYDVRGKQEYIFKSQKLKEIIGGSLVIKDIFKDYLLKEGSQDEEKIKIYNYLEKEGKNKTDFSVEEFEKRIQSGYSGEIVYDGGGNFFVLYKDKDTFEKVTHDFTYRVLKETGTLRVIGTCIDKVNFEDFSGDRKRLYEKHRITENTVQNVPLYGSLPVVMTDANSSMPIVDRRKIGKGIIKEVTHEANVKYEKYIEDKDDEILLDKIAPEKGRDSHIAIVYIDGNSMGAKVQEATKGKKTYEECVKVLRTLSEEIQDEFIESKKPVIDEVIKERHKNDKDWEKNKKGKRRVVIGAGDEINLICAAEDAMDVARAYLEDIKTHGNGERKYSSCAGIAIFKSHMPYADAYRIAEECCENCKDLMKGKEKDKDKEKEKDKNLSDVSLMDFHYCQGAIGVSLEQIREEEETTSVSRPWVVTDISRETEGRNITDIKLVDEMKKFLQGIGRSNVKGLLDAAKESRYRLEMELKRVKAHQSDSDKKAMEDLWKFVEDMDETLRQKLIYDMVLVYDLWFKKKGE